jgi:5-azacytidine-induced protein 1
MLTCREKEALARSHSRALDAAKQAAADERTAWRAAVTEKLKRQAAEREEKLRAELLKQRDEQLEVSADWLALVPQ